MRRLLTHGWLVLVLCSTLLALEVISVCAASRIWLRADWYSRRFPDTKDYEEMADRDLTDPAGLRDCRTWGFPLVVKAVREISPSYWLLPWLQLLIHVGGVLVLYAGLRQVGFCSLLAVLVCLPSLFADLITRQFALHHILTDAIGHALLLTATGAFFLVLARPDRPLRWLLLTFSIFAAYQTRPAYQSLIVAMPLCAVLLRSFVPPPHSRWLFVSVICLAALGPYLAFCTLRYQVVGHFGLVSFTGTNLAGITSVILTEEMVPHIRPEHRSLARDILQRRSLPTLKRRHFASFYLPIPQGGSAGDLWFYICYNQYDDIQWQCAWKYADEKYGKDQIRIDRALLEFSVDVIGAAPEVYAVVVGHSFSRSLLNILNRDATRVPLIGFCVLLAIAGIKRWRGKLPPEDPAEVQRGTKLLTLIGVPAIVLFLSQVCLIVLVAMPDPRYIDPAATLLPGIIVTAGYLVARRLWPLAP
jgi:hypothetical protein